MARGSVVSVGSRVIPRLPLWFGWARDREHAYRVEVLSQTPIFIGLPRRLLGRLAVQLFEKCYAPGEVIFREGDPGKGLFIVLEGEVDILQQTAEGELPLGTFGPSTAFGELALIDDLPRSATARAKTPARLVILYRSHFEALMAGEKATALVVMQNLLRTLAGYVRRAAAAHASHPTHGASVSSSTSEAQDAPRRP